MPQNAKNARGIFAIKGIFFANFTAPIMVKVPTMPAASEF